MCNLLRIRYSPTYPNCANLQVELSCLRDAIALRAKDFFSKYSLLIPVRPEKSPKILGCFSQLMDCYFG